MTENAEAPAKSSWDWAEGQLQALPIGGLGLSAEAKEALPSPRFSVLLLTHRHVAPRLGGALGRDLLCLPDGNQRQTLQQSWLHSGRDFEHFSV